MRGMNEFEFPKRGRGPRDQHGHEHVPGGALSVKHPGPASLPAPSRQNRPGLAIPPPRANKFARASGRARPPWP